MCINRKREMPYLLNYCLKYKEELLENLCCVCRKCSGVMDIEDLGIFQENGLNAQQFPCESLSCPIFFHRQVAARGLANIRQLMKIYNERLIQPNRTVLDDELSMYINSQDSE